MKKHFRNCRFSVLILVILFYPLNREVLAQGNDELLNRQVQFSMNNISIGEFIHILEAEHGFTFSYDPTVVHLNKKVTGPDPDISMNYRDLFDLVFVNNGIRYRLYDDMIILSKLRNFTISGFVENKETGEKLIGANISLANKRAGTISNNYGFFSLTVPEGRWIIEVSYVGFSKVSCPVELTGDTSMLFQLQPGMEIGEVVIRSESVRDELKTSAISATHIAVGALETLPSLLGEGDVLKMMEYLPGVQLGSEASSGIIVRGGSPEQNLILLDGVPIYNSNHAFGLFSVFNSDAIKNLTLIKGGFPARYGGRLSSVIDVRMKEGNTREFSGKVDIGTIASKVTLEGPVWKDHASFLLSARRTYVDLFLPKGFRSREDIPGFFFHDINAKINTRLKEQDRIYLSFYMGHDRFYETERFTDPTYGIYDNEDNSANWGNMTVLARWNHIYNNKLFSNLSVSYSNYGLVIDLFEEDGTRVDYKSESAIYRSGIKDLACNLEFDYYPIPTHDVKFGTAYIYHTFNTGMLSKKTENYYIIDGEEIPAPGGNLDKDNRNDPVYASEFRLFVEDDFSFGKRWFSNLGLHFSGFRVEDTFYASLEPRLSTTFSVTDKFALKAAYSRMKQYLHLMTHSGMGLPTDMWLPVTSSVKPQYSNQYTLGTVYYLNDHYKFNVEAYYKSLHQIYAYRSGADYLAANNAWESSIEMGRGYSYGAELMITKTTGKLEGWVSYTWSKTERVFDEINDGQPFPYKYDRTHQIGIVSSYRITKSLVAGATWIYATGMAYTLATEKFISFYSLYGWNIPPGGTVQYIDAIEERNNARMPDYHRLDLSISYFKDFKRISTVWNFSVYNVYNRFNPYLIYWENELGDDAKRQQKQVALFSVIPSISIRLIF